MPLKILSSAPTFELTTDGSCMLSRTLLSGKKVVFYFYSKDITPGCKTEPKEFSNRTTEFEAATKVILGVSKDSVKQHYKFNAKCHIPFTLISDEEGAFYKAYDVGRKKNMYGKESIEIVPSTYLNDDSSHIQSVWGMVNVEGHVDAALEVAQSV